MPWLEDKLIPRDARPPWRRDLLGVGLLIGLALAMAPSWRLEGIRFTSDVAGQMTSYLLLPAVGFALALRRGALDLSVWMVMALGGLVAAGLINARWDPRWAFAAATLAGLAVGLLNAAAVVWLRSSAPAATLATALVVFALGHAAVDGRAVDIPAKSFAAWQMSAPAAEGDAEAVADGNGDPSGEPAVEWLPLVVTRMLIVTIALAVALVGTRVASTFVAHHLKRPEPWALVAALAVSGAMSALGGACWLLEQRDRKSTRLKSSHYS